MPKRTPPQDKGYEKGPTKTTELVSKAKEEIEKEQVKGKYLVFEEEELKSFSKELLTAILAAYGIDPSMVDERKNTNAKLRKLILKAQDNHLREHKKTPKDLYAIRGIDKYVDIERVENKELQDHPPATVNYQMSLTKNLGDYNSMKIQVGITLPVDHTDDDLVSAKKSMQVCREVVEEKLFEDVSEVYEKLSN